MGFIVVGLDGSDSSRAALLEAVREAQWREATVIALHVVAYPISTGIEYRASIDLERLLEAKAEFVNAELEALASGHDGGFPVPVVSRVVFGHAGAELLKAAEPADSERAELVVLGSRGLGGFKGLLLGSVTTYAAHHLSCRLLILPSPIKA